jgi:beta-glucosidase/6-phospho-beta-glucosidase/beta-galactosidase/ABC-type amino acid transport substrate-binding protein
VKLPDLLFGVATSDHQAEAYEPDYADFRDHWEKHQGQTVRGRATDFWNRYPEDIGLARDLGCKLFRFSISWSRVEPRRGEFAADVLDHYRKVAETVLAADMIPLVTLHHFTWPVHVQDRGGMTAEKFPQWYRAYVQTVVDSMGELIPYWITFNEPNLLVYGYVKPWWQTSYLVPPGTPSEMTLSDQLDRAAILIRNLFLAHKVARAVIRTKSPKAKVGANPFVLGLPGLLQFFIDLLATRTSSAKAFRRRNRRLAEQSLLAQTPLDLIICRFTPTRERAAKVAFSLSYAEGVERLVVRKGSQTGKITDLAGKLVGFARGSIATQTITRLIPTARQQAFRTHRDGLGALHQGKIEGFVADDVALAHEAVPSDLIVLPEVLATSKYAVGVAKGNPDLLTLVNATIVNLSDPSSVAAPHPKAFRRIRRRGFLRVGIVSDPGEIMSHETTQLEITLARAVGKRIFGRDDCVRFEKVTLDQRVPLLTSWSRFLEPLLKTASVVGTVLNSNWWHLGMAGKLPEFLCPKECVGQQDFVGLDYYWGIDSFEFERMHQLVDASMSRFDGAPVDPAGLSRVLARFHRWFPHLELMIIENGCIDHADGFTRMEYLREHIREVTRARKLEIPARGYIWWSITSNREWGLPFGPASDFGLFHIDLDHDPQLKRVPTASAELYKQIIREETVIPPAEESGSRKQN